MPSTENGDRTHLLITLDILATVRDCLGNLSPSVFSFSSSAPPLLSLLLVSCGAPPHLLISSIHLPQLLPGEHHACLLPQIFFFFFWMHAPLTHDDGLKQHHDARHATPKNLSFFWLHTCLQRWSLNLLQLQLCYQLHETQKTKHNKLY